MNSINYIISEKLSITDYINNLYYVNDPSDDNRIEYYKMQARTVMADFIYCIYSELENQPIPFIYIYDRRNYATDSSELSKINKQIWTIGEIALAVVIYNDGITIIDTRTHLKDNDEADILEQVQDIDQRLRSVYFEGRFLENKKDYVSVSPYHKLLDHIEKNILDKEDRIGCSIELLRKLIVKFILIKYIEEQTDDNGKSVFEGYFNQFVTKTDQNEVRFCDVLKRGDVVELFDSLNEKFNGGLFNIASKEEGQEIRNANFESIADALDGTKEIDGQKLIWRLYDFKLLPIEFISRLYEKFVKTEDDKQKNYGAYYTPPHLARLLIDELLPFNKGIDFENFKLLDPSCGSGIFLVLAYKRIITLWMLKNKKQKIEGDNDIKSIKRILSNCIYGVDINPDSISITATSLQIELTSHIQPKEIFEKLHFDDLQQKGNLKECGFFKWYKTETNRYDIVVGNPPFNINNEEDYKKANDDNIKDEFYSDVNNKNHRFPKNHPALAILYLSLNNLLKPKEGKLFMIMPATTLLYNSNTTLFTFRKTIFSHWSVEKIYDFTPLRDHLWSGAAVATIAILIYQKSTGKENGIQHIIIRNSMVNKEGAARFIIDKYDKFLIPQFAASNKLHIWKSNLLGGGLISYYIEKYKTEFKSLRELFKNKGWLYQDGAKSSQKEGTDISKKGMSLLKSKALTSDHFDLDMLNKQPKGKYRLDNEELYSPPNILIKCNINQGLPSILNKQERFIFDNTFLGVKCKDIAETRLFEQFYNVFKNNRSLYKFLITVTSSKTFLQKGGNSLINSKDLKSLPINIDNLGNPIPFESISNIELAVIEDAELMANCLNKTKGKLFNPVKKEELNQYCDAFCEIINYVYEVGEYKFRLIRLIIDNDFVWISFEHTNEAVIKKEQLSNEDKVLYRNVIKDYSNNGMIINRIITYYGEKNRISFIKPRKLKYWTRSIGYRDAENVKAEMFKNEY